MSKKPRLREPFDKQHGKRAKALLKSALEHLYQIFWSFDPLLKSENITIPIQMQLSQKHKTFSQFFAEFLKFIKNFKPSKKRWPS